MSVYPSVKSCFVNAKIEKITVQLTQKKEIYFVSLKKYNTFALAFENFDSVAQQVEHIPFKDGVLGSSPS